MTTQKTILTLTLSLVAVGFLTSCGTQKSSNVITSNSTSALVIESQKALASCNRSVSSNLGFNLAAVADASNQINPDWFKIKFNFLSADVTKTGYTVKFYKWRIIGATAQLDSTPLEFSAYQLSGGQIASNPMTSAFTNQITSQFGFYIKLNDDAQNPYQVIKVAVYDTSGAVVTQSDILIPQFSASPIDYKVNADGTTRADNLQKLHPLYATDVTGWTQAKLQQSFDQYCF